MNGLMRMLVPGRRNAKSLAMMGAATWAMNRMGRRSPRAARGVRMVETATWAVPLGLMAYDKFRARRAGAGRAPLD
jgi:hypothetical protein